MLPVSPAYARDIIIFLFSSHYPVQAALEELADSILPQITIQRSCTLIIASGRVRQEEPREILRICSVMTARRSL